MLCLCVMFVQYGQTVVICFQMYIDESDWSCQYLGKDSQTILRDTTGVLQSHQTLPLGMELTCKSLQLSRFSQCLCNQLSIAAFKS